MKKLIWAAILTLVVATAAQAENYVKVDQNQNASFIVDADAVQYQQADDGGYIVIFTGYTKFNPGKGSILGPKFKNADVIETKYAIGCDSKVFRSVSTIVTEKSGKVLQRSASKKIENIPNGTFIESAWSQLCNPGSAKADGWK